MGTNYYLQEKPPCECCGRGYESRHIGKSSAGWHFSLHVYPEEGINTLEDWRRLMAGNTIFDEYGREVSDADILDIITNRGRETDWSKAPSGYTSWEQFHRLNHSEQGISGLVRGVIGGHCIGHGEGTWDYIIGDFS